MADVDLPLTAIREQLADALDLIVHQARLPDGHRQVTAVTEVVRVAAGPATRDIYTMVSGRPRWRAALSEQLAARLEAA
jgi:pilus assembly protein CpaF